MINLFLQTIKKNVIGIIISACLSLITARSIYNHLQLSQYPVESRYLYSVGIVIFCGLIIYLLGYQYAWKNLNDLGCKGKVIWLALALLFGVILVYTLPVQIPVPSVSHHLEIVSTGEKNQDSDGSEVQVLEIQDIQGDKLASYAVQLNGNWIEENNSLSIEGPGTLDYYFDGGEGKEMQILLSANPGAGILLVRIDGREEKIDLYEAEKAVTQLPLEVPLNTKMMLLLFTVDMVSYSILLLILSVLFHKLILHKPGLAVKLIILLSSGLILFTALSPIVFRQIRWEETPYQNPYGNIWLLSLLASIGTVIIIRKKSGYASAFWQRIPYLLVMAISFFLLTDWNVFYLAADSTNYVHNYFEEKYPTRPPLYPLFIQSVTSGSGFEYDIENITRDEAVYDVESPLMSVARAQKIFLYFTSLFCAASMMVVFDPVLVAWMMMGLFSQGFFSWEISYILSEPLTQSWMFLLIGVFFLFIWKKWKGLLPVAGVLTAALVLTRPAGLFGVVLLVGMVFWALLTKWRDYWKVSLLSFFLLVFLMILPSFRTYLRTGTFTMSPMYYVTQIAFALEVAEPDDVLLMPDEQSKEFLIDALERKSDQDSKIIKNYPDRLLHTSWIILSNPYQVAIPLANEMVGEGDDFRDEREKLILSVAEPILKQHRSDYIKVGLNSLQLATTGNGTRLKTDTMSFWVIISSSIILALVLRSWAGYSSMFLILSHIAHLIVIVFHDSPSRRYTEATEFFVLIAIFVLLWGVMDWIIQFFAERMMDKRKLTVSNGN